MTNLFLRRLRESGDPVAFGQKPVDSRFRGNVEFPCAPPASSNVVAISAIECRPHASTRNSPSIPALRAGPLAGWLAPRPPLPSTNHQRSSCRPPSVDSQFPVDPRALHGATGDAGWLAPLSVPWVERVAQAVADEIERQHQQKNRQTGPYRHPRRVVDVVLGGVEHAAPRGRRRLLTEAQK